MTAKWWAAAIVFLLAATVLSGCCGLDLESILGGATGGATISGMTGKNTGAATANGGTTTDRVQTVSGTVNNPAGADADEFGGKVVLTHNGQPQFVTPRRNSNGSWDFTSDLVIRPGNNNIQVTVQDESGNTVGSSNTYTVTGDLPARDIEVVLTWDTDDNDVDMHIYSPSGEHAWYSEKQGISGCFLDLDDTDGYGPETFVCETSPETGEWTVKVRYFSAHGVTSNVPTTIRTTLHEGSTQTYTHTFTADQANRDDASNDWTVVTFNMP